MLRFRLAPEESDRDPYEVMMAAHTQEQAQSDLQLKLRIRATEQMQLTVDVDAESSLNARGSGIIEPSRRERSCSRP